MGTSHVRSSMVGKAGTETITNFATIGDTSTAIVGATVTSAGALSGTVLTGSTGVVATTYVKIGSIYLFSGTVQTNSSASIVAAAQEIVTPVPKGSAFYNASPAALWSFTATMTAATLA